MDGIAPNHAGGGGKLHGWQLGGPLKESVGSQPHTRGNCTTEVFTLSSDSIESGCRAKVNYTGGTAVKGVNRDGIRNPVSPNPRWVFISNCDAGIQAGADDQRFLVQILAAGAGNPPGQRGDNRGQDDPIQLCRRNLDMFQQPQDLQSVFIRHPFVVGCQSPAGSQDAFLVQPQGEIGISHVNGQQHGLPLSGIIPT